MNGWQTSETVTKSLLWKRKDWLLPSPFSVRAFIEMFDCSRLNDMANMIIYKLSWLIFLSYVTTWNIWISDLCWLLDVLMQLLRHSWNKEKNNYYFLQFMWCLISWAIELRTVTISRQQIWAKAIEKWVSRHFDGRKSVRRYLKKKLFPNPA